MRTRGGLRESLRLRPQQQRDRVLSCAPGGKGRAFFTAAKGSNCPRKFRGLNANRCRATVCVPCRSIREPFRFASTKTHLHARPGSSSYLRTDQRRVPIPWASLRTKLSYSSSSHFLRTTRDVLPPTFRSRLGSKKDRRLGGRYRTHPRGLVGKLNVSISIKFILLGASLCLSTLAWATFPNFPKRRVRSSRRERALGATACHSAILFSTHPLSRPRPTGQRGAWRRQTNTQGRTPPGPRPRVEE